ncbi:hypothetical protein [Bosea sp. PAMC 26642]|uniref:hypothetical protein n=1 Tax=Bosea sp. (strain PAMC 26642) TaxID=1792307 RepID=UPI0012E87D61|nr:hypothetical protein [Bosea sp. PAMC 26642]
MRSELLPEISGGLANMPHGDAFSLLVRLASAMLAGVILSSARRDPSHPVRRCADELTKLGFAERVPNSSIEELVQLTQEVGAQIWRLIEFQSDPELRENLLRLVMPICLPAARLI